MRGSLSADAVEIRLVDETPPVLRMLQRDLAEKNVRVQTVLPGPIATESWDVAGYALQRTLPITMTAEDLVDAALAGMEQGEQVDHRGSAGLRWCKQATPR